MKSILSRICIEGSPNTPGTSLGGRFTHMHHQRLTFDVFLADSINQSDVSDVLSGHRLNCPLAYLHFWGFTN